MWRMLTSRAEDLHIELVECDAAEESGVAHWLADYTFTQTGRPVHNDVRARFRFLTSPVMAALGRWSYGIFIWHLAVLAVVFPVLGIAPFDR